MSAIWSPGFRRWAIGLPLVWLALFFLAPFLMTLAISFGEAVDAAPPFRLDAPALGFLAAAGERHDLSRRAAHLAAHRRHGDGDRGPASATRWPMRSRARRCAGATCFSCW
jgi:hypothetical protein